MSTIRSERSRLQKIIESSKKKLEAAEPRNLERYRQAIEDAERDLEAVQTAIAAEEQADQRSQEILASLAPITPVAPSAPARTVPTPAEIESWQRRFLKVPEGFTSEEWSAAKEQAAAEFAKSDTTAEAAVRAASANRATARLAFSSIESRAAEILKQFTAISQETET